MIRKFKFFDGFTENSYVFDNLNLTAIHVEGGQRTLRAMWTRETEEQLNAYHGIDAAAELSREMGAQISREIDDDIVRRLMDIISNVDTETDQEVIRGINTLNSNYRNHEENDEILDEINRRINGGNRA